jgi:hypothetical protein
MYMSNSEAFFVIVMENVQELLVHVGLLSESSLHSHHEISGLVKISHSWWRRRLCWSRLDASRNRGNVVDADFASRGEEKIESMQQIRMIC